MSGNLKSKAVYRRTRSGGCRSRQAHSAISCAGWSAGPLWGETFGQARAPVMRGATRH